MNHKVYTTGGDRLNTKNRRFRGKDFFNENRTRTHTDVKELAPFDPEAQSFDVDNCTRDPAEMAEIACTYVEDLLQKRKLRKDVQQVLLAAINNRISSAHSFEVISGKK